MSFSDNKFSLRKKNKYLYFFLVNKIFIFNATKGINMYKKILAFNLFAISFFSYSNSQSTIEYNLRSHQLNTAERAMHDLTHRPTKASMEQYITGIGVTGAIATLYWGEQSPDLKKYVLTICASTAAAGLFITWTGDNKIEEPKTLEKLTNIIAGKDGSEVKN